jgi:hypothetical protein
MTKPKLMLLSVYGAGTEYHINSWERLITVLDEEQTLAQMRIVALKELAAEVKRERIPDEQQMNILRALRIKLIDTGLTEMPETEEERIALWSKMTNRDAVDEKPPVTA